MTETKVEESDVLESYIKASEAVEGTGDPSIKTQLVN